MLEKVYLYKRIVQAKLFIDQHYAEKIDLDNIADEARFSKFHFIRLFKKVYGKTPHHYLTQVRVEYAKLLLAKRNTVAAVSFDVGFESITSFSGLFKKIVGVTPSAYQQQQHVRKLGMQTNPLRYIPNCFVEKA